MKKDAFTLLELLIVLAIVSILSGLGVASYRRQYARAQFRSGVVQVQVDIHRTRLLAMRSGDAYVFRFVPGSFVYEIAPLKTLQEAIYRANGDSADLDGGALGGSLSSVPYSENEDYASSGSFSRSSNDLYSDDLFSQENIAADLATRRASEKRNATFNAPSLTNADSDWDEQYSMDSGSDWNDGYAANDPYYSDYTGNGASFSMDRDLTSSALNMGSSGASIDVREMTAEEKQLASENVVASRVATNGVVVRKRTAGEVLFTSLRISESTPSNLRSKRARGAASSSDADRLLGTDDRSGEDLGSRLGGSLTSIPTGADDGEGLGGGLSLSEPSENAAQAPYSSGQELARVSLWSEPIVFYPNGKTSTAIIGFASLGDYQYFSEIALRGMTGVARISSISAIPPGGDPELSVLTKEQLFRQSSGNARRNVEYADENELNDELGISGGALGAPDMDDGWDAANAAIESPDAFDSSNASSGYLTPQETQTQETPIGVDANFDGGVL